MHRRIAAWITALTIFAGWVAAQTWEIAYNHFHDRMGQSLPRMAAVLPAIRPTGVNHHMNWETLTHAGMGSIGLPPVRK